MIVELTKIVVLLLTKVIQYEGDNNSKCSINLNLSNLNSNELTNLLIYLS